MMTLRDIIRLRQEKTKKLNQGVSEPWWGGYHTGWSLAYRDLREILEQNGFDLDVVVIK